VSGLATTCFVASIVTEHDAVKPMFEAETRTTPVQFLATRFASVTIVTIGGLPSDCGKSVASGFLR
jgi:hypothetical protein